MTLMQLKCFWTVGTIGSFTEAAELLYISQSAVSKNIAALEQELSIPLFNRNGKTVELSANGRRMFEYCDEIIKMLKYMETEAEKIRLGAFSDSQIRLAGVPTLAAFGVISLINDFSAKNPEYEVIIEELEEDKVLFLLQSGSCDVAFSSNLKISEKNYNMLKVCHEDFSVALSKDNELAGKNELELAHLKGQKLIFNKQESMLYDLCYNACVAAGFTPTVIMQTSRIDIAMEYVEGNCCCFMGLTRVLNDKATSGLRIMSIADSPGFDYVLCWKKSDYISPALKRFIDFCKRSIKQ